MLDQREAPIPAAPAEDITKKPQSHIAAFNVGGLNLAPASNDETFELDADDPGTPDLFNESGAGNKSADRKATEFTNEMGMSADVKLGNGGGSLSQLSLREIEERKRERAAEAIEAFLERAAEHDKEVKAAQAKWDAEMHDYGGEKLSGAEIMRRIEWFEKKENQDKVRDQLRKQGKTEQEIEETIRKMKERDELMKRQRNGEKLSPEEQLRLDALNKDKEVRVGTEMQSTISKKDKALEADNNRAIAKSTDLKDLSALETKEASGKITTAELARLNEIKSDPSSQSIRSLILNGAPKPVESASADVSQLSEAKKTFPTAAPAKQDFTLAASGTAPAAELTKADPKVAQAAEPPKITTARIDAAASAVM